MKADRDDMPDYLKPEKKKGHWRLIIAIGITSALMWWGAEKYGQPIIVDIEKNKSGFRLAETPIQTGEEGLEGSRVDMPSQGSIIKHQYIDSSAQEWQEPKSTRERQTVFNDQNYQPRTNINTIESVRPAQYAANTSSQKPKSVRKNQYAYWNWTYADRKRKRIRIEWETVNGWIDTTTVCHNERKGSIEYRDCRKTAKDYFTHRCKTENREAFCRAQSFNPL